MEHFQLQSTWGRILWRMARLVGLPVMANSFALYANRNSRCNLKGCLDIIRQEFLVLGNPPDLIGYGTSGEMIPFDKGINRLSIASWDDIDSVSIKRSRKFGGLISGWSVSAAISAKYGYLIFSYGNDVGQFDVSSLVSFARRLWREFEFDYGIAYQRPVAKGADIYALGLVAGLGYSQRDKQERQEIAKWFNANQYFQEHGSSYSFQLRDVYEVNFLSPIHLDSQVDSMRLENWIKVTPSRGIMEPLISDRVVWRIERNDIQAVREVLMKNRLLIAHRLDVPPISIPISTHT